MEQQHNRGKVEGFMAELGRKLDYLFERARQGAEDARLSDKMEELKQATDKLENELHEFVQDNEKWKEVQVHLQGAAQELKKAFETTFKSKKQPHQTQQEAWQQNPASGSNNGTSNSAGTTSSDAATDTTAY